MRAGSGPDQLDGKGVESERGGGGGPEEAGVEFWHLCDTLVASPGLLEVFSLVFCLRLSGPDQLDGKGVGSGKGGGGGGPEEAGVEFWHLCDTLVASPSLLEVFSLAFCLTLLTHPCLT